MAVLEFEGRKVAVSLEFYERVIPNMRDEELYNTLQSLGVIEQVKERGLLLCDNWAEVVAVAKKICFEIKWRSFSRPLGITLEVR